MNSRKDSVELKPAKSKTETAEPKRAKLLSDKDEPK